MAAVAVKHPAFQDLGAEILVVSTDTINSHSEWQEKVLSRMVHGGACSLPPWEKRSRDPAPVASPHTQQVHRRNDALRVGAGKANPAREERPNRASQAMGILEASQRLLAHT